MSNWLKAYEPVRAQPRLWVETMWLVESREPLAFTRTIDLHTGLNIVWGESASNEGSGLTNAGHGMGKTSLCLLLRYVLGDDAPAIATLRNKAAGGFPKGGVAAKVHVDDAVWLVFRPYGAYSQPMAAQCDALNQLLQGTAVNDFDGYSYALAQFSIGRLAARSLPGTNQPLEWRHLLAWCIREQRTRFDGFYHWREGEGLGFKRSRRDPPLLVGSVLGLVDLELDRLLRDIEAKQKQVEQCKERISELERAPTFALTHADRQLRLRVKSEEDEPVFMTTVGESLESRVQAAVQAAELEERRLERDVEQAEDVLAGEQVCLHELNKARELAELTAGYLDGLPTSGSDAGRGYRDLEMEKQVEKGSRETGIGAQFGGKYFVHDVRVIRLPRHGASCPIGVGVSCTADRNIKGKITKEGVFLEQLEFHPEQYLPNHLKDAGAEAIQIDLNKPLAETLKILSQQKVATRVMLNGPMIVARDIAHAKLKEKVDRGEGVPEYFKQYAVYYAGPAKTPKGYASGSFGPTTSERTDPYVGTFQSLGGSMIMLGKGNRSPQVTEACQKYGGFYLGSIGGPAARLGKECITKVEVLDFPELGIAA